MTTVEHDPGTASGGRCIAMWSGPRNLSTAMMRAWGNRPDTTVIDEPFYAHFLHATGIDHPMREAVIEAGDTDWRRVAERLATPPAGGLVYQKHITTHWQPDFTTEWLSGLSHAFLIRAPGPVVASYANKRPGGTPADLGYPQQAALFDAIATMHGEAPPVIDSERFLADPEGQLRTLCERLDVRFDARMLRWPRGARDSDGVWGAHWYDAVNRSTGFAAPARADRQPVALDPLQQRVADTCRPYYESLLRYAL